MIKKSLAVLTALTLYSGVANAELVETDWLELGDALSVLDTKTGLEWLDFTQTGAMSINQVESLLTTQFKGWRLPTENEIIDLMRGNITNQQYNAGGYLSVGNEAEYQAERQTFYDSFGHLNDIRYSLALYEQENGNVAYAGVNSTTFAYLGRSSLNTGSSSANYGVFLVSDGGTTLTSINNPNINTPGFEGNVHDLKSVPLTGSVTLMGLGLAGLTFRRKK